MGMAGKENEKKKKKKKKKTTAALKQSTLVDFGAGSGGGGGDVAGKGAAAKASTVITTTTTTRATTRATSLKRTRASDLAVSVSASEPPSSSLAIESEADDLSATASSPAGRAVKVQRRLSAGARSEDEESLVTSPATEGAAAAAFAALTTDAASTDTGSADAGDSNYNGSSGSSSSAGAASAGKGSGNAVAKTKTAAKVPTSPSSIKTNNNNNNNNKASTYADPSKYAHLKELTDIMEPNLLGIFVGFNPGIATATAGHAYAHPSNRFWKLLHESGITDKLCRPVYDRHLPRLYQMGNTNIVGRPSRDIGELAEGEMSAGTPALEAKVRKYRPESVCIVGKAIWEGIWKHWYGKRIRREEFKYGWQDERHNMGVGGEDDDNDDDDDDDGDDDDDDGDDDGNGDDQDGEQGAAGGDGDEKKKKKKKNKPSSPWKGARVFVATSTSGLSTIPTYPQKVEIWKDYGNWINERRAARAKEKDAADEKQ